jgi:hypothetical protein
MWLLNVWVASLYAGSRLVEAVELEQEFICEALRVSMSWVVCVMLC